MVAAGGIAFFGAGGGTLSLTGVDAADAFEDVGRTAGAGLGADVAITGATTAG